MGGRWNESTVCSSFGSCEVDRNKTTTILRGGATEFKDLGKFSQPLAERKVAKEGGWGTPEIAVRQAFPDSLLGGGP